MDITIGQTYAVNKITQKKEINEGRVCRGKVVAIRQSRSRKSRLNDEHGMKSKTLIIVTNSEISSQIVGKTVLIRVIR